MKKTAACLFLSSSLLLSADIYTITVTDTTTNETFTKGSSNLEDIINYFDEAQLQTYIPNYNSTDNASAVLDMRGLPVNLSYVGNTLTFSVPSLNITESFTGVNRDESEDLFGDWLEKNGASTMERIMKES